MELEAKVTDQIIEKAVDRFQFPNYWTVDIEKIYKFLSLTIDNGLDNQ